MVENTSDTYVIDASYLLAYVLPDESTERVDKVFARYQKRAAHFIAPPLLRYEVLGGLRSAVLKKRIEKRAAMKLMLDFLVLDITYDDVTFDDIFRLSLETSLTVYDASYLWLARKRAVPLLTRDQKLLAHKEAHTAV